MAIVMFRTVTVTATTTLLAGVCGYQANAPARRTQYHPNPEANVRQRRRKHATTVYTSFQVKL